MKKYGKLTGLFALLLAVMLLLSACAADAAVTGRKKKKNTARPTVTVTATETPTAAPEETGDAAEEPTEEPGPIIEPQRIADYLFEHGELPDNFITKKEAQALGWDSRYNYVSDVAPGMSIGGDYFGNYEGKLPRVKGRKYYEADCWYTEGPRNAYRIIYSTDGHVWYTEDHYNTFTEMSPSEP
jgi:hypothetical protein